MRVTKPKEGEARDDFVARCMVDLDVVSEFPDREQRAAVCFRQFDEGKGMNLKHFQCGLEVKETDDTGMIVGYGSIFNNVDQGGDIVAPGAFKASLKARGMPAMLWSHNAFTLPVGKWHDATEDKKGLRLEGELFIDTEVGKHLHTALAAKAVTGLSIGYVPVKSELDDDDDVRTLKEVDLFEVSFVNFPMNESARVEAVKARLGKGELPTKRMLEVILRDAGFTREQSKALIAHGYGGLTARDDDREAWNELETLRFN